MTTPEYFRRDLARIDEIASRPGAVIEFEDGSKGFNPGVITEGELSFITGVYSIGYANGWL